MVSRRTFLSLAAGVSPRPAWLPPNRRRGRSRFTQMWGLTSHTMTWMSRARS